MSIIPSFGRQKHEDQEIKVIFSYLEILRPAWATRDLDLAVVVVVMVVVVVVVAVVVVGVMVVVVVEMKIHVVLSRDSEPWWYLSEGGRWGG